MYEINIAIREIEPKTVETNEAELSICNLNSLFKNSNPKRGDIVPEICSSNNTKLNNVEKIILNINNIDIGLVSLFIVLVKLTSRIAIKTDKSKGSPGINQEKFKIIVIKIPFL